jgi:hypothetical protein
MARPARGLRLSLRVSAAAGHRLNARDGGTAMNARKRLPAAAWFMAAACAVAMIWVAAESDGMSHAFEFKGQKTDYYSLLVSGFRHGHLYMDVEVDPRLASKDPAIVAHAPTLQDASYYEGHFYLYYGVVPAALLLLPYHLLTGQDIGINVACLVFWMIGFGASLYWLKNWWRDNGPGGGTAVASLMVAVLSFFPATTFLVRRAMFYELPLVAGFACISVFFAAIYEAIHGRRPLAALAFSSAAIGLAVGCHPNHILLIPLLLWASMTASRNGKAVLNPWHVAAASFIPAAAIGAGLAWYNYARFGNIFESGFRFGQNEFFTSGRVLFMPRFLWANLRWYLLTPPALAPYFPFVFPENNTFRPAGYVGAEAMHGALPATLLFIWILLGAAVRGRARKISSTDSRYSAVLACAVLGGLAFVCSLQIRANRYMTDFETPLAWILSAWGCLVWIGLSPGFFSRLWRLVFSFLIFVGALFYVLAAVQQFELFRNTRPMAFSRLSRALDIPYRSLYGLGVDAPGLLSMTARFQHHDDLVIEPLVTTGTPGYSDSVNVAQYPNHAIQFRFDHRGYGGPMSPIIPIDINRSHLIQISMGSFYPPIGDGYFRTLPNDASHLLKSLAYVRLDGKVIMCAPAAFYEGPPWSRQTGSNDTTITEFGRTFSGVIAGTAVVPVDSFLDLLNLNARSGVLAFKVRFPERYPVSGLPILGCGIKGDGNLVFAKAVGGSSYRMELDDWSYGALTGKSFDATQGTHTLQIVVGPMLVQSKLAEAFGGAGNLSVLADRIVVALDGRILGAFKVTHHLEQIGKLTPGANPQGFSTALPEFGGGFDSLQVTDSQVGIFLADAVKEVAP